MLRAVLSAAKFISKARGTKPTLNTFKETKHQHLHYSEWVYSQVKPNTGSVREYENRRLQLATPCPLKKKSFITKYAARVAPFVPYNKDRLTKRSFDWQNKFVAPTTGPLVAGLNRMWTAFRQQKASRKGWSLFHITGGPGVGKTRYGAEILHSLTLPHAYTSIMDPLMKKAFKEAYDKGYYLFINMSGSADGEYLREDAGSIPKMIAAKLLQEEANEILCPVKVGDLASLIEMRLRPATSDNPLVLQIHIDEIQTQLSEQQLRSIRTSGTVLNQMFKEFMETSLHLAKHHIFLLVVTSGSLDLSFKGLFPSDGFSVQKLVLEPVNDDDAIALLAARRNINPQNPFFQRLVKAQGGLLRLLEKLDR